MLRTNSVKLAVNLSLALHQHNKSLTPAPNTLLQQLCSSSYTPINPKALPGLQDLAQDQLCSELTEAILASSTGQYEVVSGQNQYYASSHDTLMDNYIRDLTAIVTSHLQYARSVVYPKVMMLTELVTSSVNSRPVKNAEDFFNITFFKPDPIFQSSLMEDEVLGFDASSGKSAHTINFGDCFNDFNLASYVSTGDDDIDSMIVNWVSGCGSEKLMGYIRNTTSDIEYSLSQTQMLDYALANFLFYRALSIKQDMAQNLGVIQLVTKASDNRDYFARALRLQLEQYKTMVRQGVVLARDTMAGGFSYHSNTQYNVVIYDEVFEVAAQEGCTLEQIFGYLSANSSTNLTVTTLKEQGAEFANTWKTIRGLYVTHALSSRDSAIRMALKLNLDKALELDLSEQEQAFYEANTGFRQKSMELSSHFIDSLAIDDDCIPDACLKIVAGICHRHSNAYTLLQGMLEIVKKDPKTTMPEAALFTLARYLTDFMIEQSTVTS